MARTGLYQSDVKKARDTLLAQGRHPSVDAVRVALGNTGSKTTIHKYLKELEAEEGSAGRTATVSDALQDLVERLATRLQEEADLRIAAIETKAAESERSHAEAASGLQQELDAARALLKELGKVAEDEKKLHAKTQASLHAETVARHTAEQQAAGLKDRLAENEAHRKSLEEKHVHARDALEHYRQSVKEQRDQDVRRHEHQVQQLQSEIRLLQQGLIVRQDEVTKLNKEGARLVADLFHTRQTLVEAQQASAHKETESASRLAAMQKQAETRIATLDQQSMETRLELAAQQRETSLLNKEVRRLQGQLEQLQQEKAIWTQERVALEELARQRE